MKNYINLGNNISSGNDIEVKNILDSNPMLDILHSDGTFIIRAIENNQLKILQFLINHFEKNQLVSDFVKLKSEMQSIIDIAIEDIELSPKLKEVIQPYLLDQVSTTDSLNENSDISDPMDALDPSKHFSDTSTQDSSPEKELSGEFSANTNITELV